MRSNAFPVPLSQPPRQREAGLLYACYETAEELERKRRVRLARGLPPVYDRAGLAYSAEQRAEFEREGRRPHWRFKLSQRPVAWTDLVRGETTMDTHHLSDPVLLREDGMYLYTLPSCVDDIDYGVTHVVRGEDHATNTAVQIALLFAVGLMLTAAMRGSATVANNDYVAKTETITFSMPTSPASRTPLLLPSTL